MTTTAETRRACRDWCGSLDAPIGRALWVAPTGTADYRGYCTPECARERRRVWDVHYLSGVRQLACGEPITSSIRFAGDTCRADVTCSACLAAMSKPKEETVEPTCTCPESFKRTERHYVDCPACPKPEKPTKVEVGQRWECHIGNGAYTVTALDGERCKVHYDDDGRGVNWDYKHATVLADTFLGYSCRRCLSKLVADGVELCEGCRAKDEPVHYYVGPYTACGVGFEVVRRAMTANDWTAVTCQACIAAKFTPPTPSPVPAEPAPEGLSFAEAVEAPHGTIQCLLPEWGNDWLGFDRDESEWSPAQLWAMKFRRKPKPVPAPRPSRVEEMLVGTLYQGTRVIDLLTRAVKEAIKAADPGCGCDKWGSAAHPECKGARDAVKRIKAALLEPRP